MTTTQFLAEWALRSSILILAGALLLWALRVKDSAVRLVALTAVLCGSLAIPALNAVAPKTPLPVMRIVSPVQQSTTIREAVPTTVAPRRPRRNHASIGPRPPSRLMCWSP